MQTICRAVLVVIRALAMVVVISIALVTLSACGSSNNSDDGDRSFAPETGTNAQLPTETPGPTSTPAPVDRQPGEVVVMATPSEDLFKASGSAAALTSGVDRVTVVHLDSGKATDLPVRRTSAILAAAAPDGSRCLVIDRSGGHVSVRMYGAGGKETASWSPKSRAATVVASPIASPTPGASSILTGDRIAWKRDGSGAVIAVSGVGVFVADAKLKMTPLTVGQQRAVTAVAWSPSEESIAVGAWDAQRQAASIVTVSLQSPDSEGTSVLALPDGDGRYVRSLAWGTARVGLVFALRAASTNFSLPNDLYYLPRFGQPMRLLASAGVAAPAAVIDQVAVAGNGTTVAFTVLIPGQVGLRFHSVWVTDAVAPGLIQADTSGLRRVSDVEWTTVGLAVSGTRRTQQAGAAYQIAVVDRLTAAASKQISADRSAATPVASPVASPAPATPVETR
jgi:hypothetical protein